MKGYSQFCPVAKAAEILTERWTLLVLRELLLGSRHFNDFRRGLPTISPTLLVKRLQMLQEQGLLTRVAAARGHGYEYRPTRAAEDLRPLMGFLGHWGQRWVRSKLTRDELDPGVLMWFIHRHFAVGKLPSRRVVVYLEFTDVKRLRRCWIVVGSKGGELCLNDPGFEVDVSIHTDLLTLTQVYMGDVSFRDGCSSGRIKVLGAPALIRTLPDWFARSKFADTKAGVTTTKQAPLPALDLP